jgi:glyceraldehyde-3-phosphate dehydrogenase (NAD(P))
MSAPKVVHVVGTGTIGEPLIGMLVRKRKELGIDAVTFHKRTPLLTDRSKVTQVCKAGAELAVNEENWGDFEELGMKPKHDAKSALENATVVVDCTPVGNQNKERIYSNYTSNTLGFIAQGSEHGFGKPYALDINDAALHHGADQFLQVVSCNTHNIACLLDSLARVADDPSNLEEGRFMCIRRATDISQEDGHIPSPKIGAHKIDRYGTHHARDAHDLFATMDMDLNLFSSAMQVSTQYMHTLHFSLRLKERVTLQDVEQRLRNSPRVAVSYKSLGNQIFSFGRDYGIFGRILNQTVVPLHSLAIRDNGHEVVGFCFTPQDGNSLMTSMAAVEWFLNPETYQQKLSAFDAYCFKEI